ncbi:MBL fold metallo-hydrolase [Chitinophaga sp. MM2321]|uniref:MBL fold metallo-hydrolase n=1 Tax=Chitinophaga sp. MM2321 TaxID=3137178 RepID=UPI0032D59DBC
MQTILAHHLSPPEAALWWLGQAGYVIRASGLMVVIDPYLSDAAGAGSPEFSRQYPPPVNAAELRADIYIITHDHLDHLDPDTLSAYRHKEDTWFVAPVLAAKKLVATGIPATRIVTLHAGETWQYNGIEITGVFALPTGIDVLDTTGYLVKFANGRSIYHTSDTQFHPIVLAAAPKEPEVMLVPINGKWGNPGPEQAAAFALAVQPTYVMPNHYDLMALNAENPASFKWFCDNNGLVNRCIIPERMQPFVW